MNPNYQHYANQLQHLKQQHRLRSFTENKQYGKWIELDAKVLLNLSSNDYLGLAHQPDVVDAFFKQYELKQAVFSSSSSRLLTGNFPQYSALEQRLCQWFGRPAALVFNSGYHMNIGIIPAISDLNTLILSDQLIHASIIDGIRLSKAHCIRYPHNDLNRLEEILKTEHKNKQWHRIIIVTESIFSMDGDETDLTALVALKAKYQKVMLYLDEAHAVGVRGRRGLGCAEQHQCLDQIDFLVGTFGKALASSGGYLICEPILRDYLINHMRSLIFSTALAPINLAWTQFMIDQVENRDAERQHLAQISADLKQKLETKGFKSPSSSHIVPIIVGDNDDTIQLAKHLQQQGLYVMPVRPPTVPVGTSRLRLCLHSELTQDDIDQLLNLL